MNTERNTKPRMELIEPSMLEALAWALQYGAQKYGVGNYHEVPEEEFFGAMLRHYASVRRGEDIDQESGLPHTSHMLANAAIIVAKRNNVPRGTFGIAEVAKIIKETSPEPFVEPKRVTIDSLINESIAASTVSSCPRCAHNAAHKDDCGDLASCQFESIQ